MKPSPLGLGRQLAAKGSWGVFVVAVGICLVVLVAATTLPTLPALRRSEPRVVAGLVAE